MRYYTVVCTYISKYTCLNADNGTVSEIGFECVLCSIGYNVLPIIGFTAIFVVRPTGSKKLPFKRIQGVEKITQFSLYANPVKTRLIC